MKKNLFAISVGIVLIGTVFCYLQFGREIDVGNSFSMNSSNYKQERINVILNKLIVTDCKEEIADTIIKKTLDNDFHTIRFNFDSGYPNTLNVSVYKTDKDIRSGNMLFSFSYEQIDGEIGEYDISQSEHMKLEIHE